MLPGWFNCGPCRRRGSSDRPTPWNEMVLSGSLSQAFDDAGCVHGDFLPADGHRRERRFTAGPADLDLLWRFRGRHDLHGAVLRPIAAAGMSLSDWPLPLTKDQSHLRANSGGIARRAFESDSQARLGSYIAVKFGFASVLRYHQIHATVAIVVAQRRAALFSID